MKRDRFVGLSGPHSGSAKAAHDDSPRFARHDNGYPRLHDVLCKWDFLKQVRREKHRADRSGAPLALALFHFEDRRRSECEHVETLLKVLQGCSRETDTLGYLGKDVIAMLLPDTNAEGAERFVQKIMACTSNPPFLVSARTYPDHLFASLAAEYRVPLASDPFLLDRAGEPSTSGKALKRGIDLLGAVAGLVLLSPILAATAIAVAVTSPGPIIYKQVRLGRGGVPFVFYKFRSMFCDADDRLHREHVTNLIKSAGKRSGETPAQPWQKLESDPRVTRIGKFLRSTCLDELPQLFNVIKGDLSLVGPRPPLPYEVTQYQSWHLRRVLEMKPGISGLWQVGGQNLTTFDDMVRMDIRYQSMWSNVLDLKIILQTAKVVLRRRGSG